MARRPHVVITVVRTCLVAGLVAALLSGCGTDQPGTASSATGSPSVSPSASTSTSTGGAGPVAIYYAGNAGSAGVRLYREFHARPLADAVNAVDAMVNERPSDPDYRSLWPTTAQVIRASKSGPVETVDMKAGPSAPAAIAIQQLVWTVTAADRSVSKVQILVQGRPLTPAPVGRGAASEVLGPIWVLAPLHGATVAHTFTISGDATVFEATVSWEVRQGATVIRRGFVTASAGAPGRGAWRASVTVPAAGSYQVVAFESSAKDGTALFADTKSITVR